MYSALECQVLHIWHQRKSRLKPYAEEILELHKMIEVEKERGNDPKRFRLFMEGMSKRIKEIYYGDNAQTALDYARAVLGDHVGRFTYDLATQRTELKRSV